MHASLEIVLPFFLIELYDFENKSAFFVNIVDTRRKFIEDKKIRKAFCSLKSQLLRAIDSFEKLFLLFVLCFKKEYTLFCPINYISSTD